MATALPATWAVEHLRKRFVKLGTMDGLKETIDRFTGPSNRA